MTVFNNQLDNGELAALRAKRKWAVYIGEHEVCLEETVREAVTTSLHFSNDRDVRIITPNGIRLSVAAASLLL